MACHAVPVVVGVEVVALVPYLTRWIAKKDYVNEVQLELVSELFPADNMPGTELIKFPVVAICSHTSCSGLKQPFSPFDPP